MMGRRSQDQRRLFYEFHLDEAVPADHLVRKIRALLDLSWVYAELLPYYSGIGRPSIDPVLMIRMLIIGYVFAIRSERRICREVQVNLAYRWFCDLGLEDAIPDHSAFSRARNERFRASDIFRQVFRVCRGVVHRGWPGRRRGLRRRCEPDRSGRQPPALDSRHRVEERARPCGSEPGSEGVSRHAERRGFWGGDRGRAEVRLALRPRRPMDRRAEGPGLLRLCGQLPD